MRFRTPNLLIFLTLLFANIQIMMAQSYSDENDNLTLPFSTTTISGGKFADNTPWYTVSINNGKYWSATASELDCSSYMEDVADCNLFCFVGDNVNGFKIYCKALGVSTILYCASSTSHEAVVPTNVSSTGTPNTFKLSENNGGYNFYYPGNKSACMNDLHGDGIVTLWTNSGAPTNTGCRLYFNLVEGKEQGGETTDDSEPTLNPVTCPVRYIYFKSGEVNAYPVDYAEVTSSGDEVAVTFKSGDTYKFDAGSIDSISETAPTNLPSINSFKFNNKFNDMLMVDAQGEIIGDSIINISVGGIGKRLVPSINVNGDGAVIYVGADKQESKVTSRRFEQPTTYTITRPGLMMLRETSDGKYDMYPFGHDYVVNVDYLCDHPTTDYGVPVIRITTDDGTMISSKDYYWHGTITIDGAGYYPDMATMEMDIKGRGNSSWSSVSGWSNPKNPYRIKFDAKQKPLGMTAGKNWNLIAQSQTGSMTTNMIGSRVSEMVKTDGANHFIPVELYINGDYRGSYCLTEKVGMSNNSISLDDESNATLLELDSYSYDFTTTARFPSQGLPVTYHYPDFTDPTDITNLTATDIKNSFNAFATAVSQGKDLSPYIDFVSTARFLMVNDLIVNYELQHPKSTFCYNENVLADSLYHFGPTWDFDWAFGYEDGKNYFKNNATSNYYTDASSNLERKSFIQKLRNSGEEMNKQYYRVWTDFMNNHLSDLCEYCTDYYNAASKSFEHDNSKWSHSTNYQTITDNSISWLQKRAAYVYDYLSNTLGYADKGYLEPDPEPIPDVIEDVTSVSTKAVGIYDLTGRRLDADYQSLPKGIYIINGRKMFKR